MGVLPTRRVWTLNNRPIDPKRKDPLTSAEGGAAQ